MSKIIRRPRKRRIRLVLRPRKKPVFRSLDSQMYDAVYRSKNSPGFWDKLWSGVRTEHAKGISDAVRKADV